MAQDTGRSPGNHIPNGSGKSTYVKIFRKLSENYFTNAKDLSLKSNIYMPLQQTEQSVFVSYENGDRKVNNEKVNINAYHEELSKINVCLNLEYSRKISRKDKCRVVSESAHLV